MSRRFLSFSVTAAAAATVASVIDVPAAIITTISAFVDVDTTAAAPYCCLPDSSCYD